MLPLFEARARIPQNVAKSSQPSGPFSRGRSPSRPAAAVAGTAASERRLARIHNVDDGRKAPPPSAHAFNKFWDIALSDHQISTYSEISTPGYRRGIAVHKFWWEWPTRPFAAARSTEADIQVWAIDPSWLQERGKEMLLDREASGADQRLTLESNRTSAAESGTLISVVPPAKSGACSGWSAVVWTPSSILSAIHCRVWAGIFRDAARIQ